MYLYCKSVNLLFILPNYMGSFSFHKPKSSVRSMCVSRNRQQAVFLTREAHLSSFTWDTSCGFIRGNQTHLACEKDSCVFIFPACKNTASREQLLQSAPSEVSVLAEDIIQREMCLYRRFIS